MAKTRKKTAQRKTKISNKKLNAFNKLSKKLRIASLIFGLALGAAAAYAVGSGTFAVNDPCFKKTEADARITIQGHTATASFKVNKECDRKQHATLVVYGLKDGVYNAENLTNQRLLEKNNGFFEPGIQRHELSVTIPDCTWQVDLLRGNVAPNLENGDEISGVLVAMVGNEGVPCDTPLTETPPPPTTPPETPPPTTPPETPPPTTPPTTTPPTTRVVDQKGADELPNTGPVAVVGTFFGVTALGTLIFEVVSRRFSL